MDILIMLAVMVVVGMVIGALAGVIWKGERPFGTVADYAIAVGTTVIIGLVDWFVIPALIKDEIWVYIGLATEPWIAAIFVLWLIRRSRR